MRTRLWAVVLAVGLAMPLRAETGHDDTRNDDRSPDRLDRRPEHRRDMSTCQDDLKLDSKGRGDPIPFRIRLHTHRCHTRSNSCDFNAWTLYGDFGYDPDEAGPLPAFDYQRARTESERQRVGTPEDHGTRGQWLESDPRTGNLTGRSLRDRVEAVRAAMGRGATYRQAVTEAYSDTQEGR